MIENWKTLVAYGEHQYSGYEVSDLGRVRSYRSAEAVATGQPVLMVPGLNGRGYLHMCLYDVTGRRHTLKLHLLVLTVFVAPRPAGMWGGHGRQNHVDGIATDKCDNRLLNLEWLTPSQNLGADKHRDGSFKGMRDGDSRLKLSSADVAGIRQALAEGVLRQKDIAAIYGTQQSNISRIKLGKRLHGAA